jgi:HEAT repeat protein
MKLHTLVKAVGIASFVLALPTWAQRGQPGEGPPKPGGNWTGPGDTVPTGGSGGGSGGGGGGNPPPAPPTTGSPAGPEYAPGYNPLSPKAPPPGVEGLPGSVGEAPPPKPTTPPRSDTLNTWQSWWHYNRWAHLAVDGSMLADTGSGGFFLGHGEKTQTAPLIRATQNQIRDVVQPALARALGQGGQAEFEIYALHALAKIRGVPLLEGESDFLTVSKPFLRSANQYVSEKAVLALGIRGDDAYLPLLVGVLGDMPEGRDLVGRSLVSDRLRAFAAYGLGLLGERTLSPAVRSGVYDALMGALPGERDEVQAACLHALGFVPMPTGAQYIEGGGELFAGRSRLDQVVNLLAFFKDTAQPFTARAMAPNALARLLDGCDELPEMQDIRRQIAYTLLEASNPMSAEMREVQNAAIIALGMLGRSGEDPLDQEIREHLERVAYKSSSDRSARYLAMIAMAEVATRRGGGKNPFAGLEPTRRTLQRNLNRAKGMTLAWTALALGVLEEDAIERGEVASPDSGKALRAALEKARSVEVGGALCIALGLVRDPEAAPLLLTRLNEAGEGYMRGYAALALGMIGASSATEPVRQILANGSSQPFAVENAAIALALLGDQETGKRLFSVLDRSANPKVQSSVASAMGWIRDPRPLGDLATMLGDVRRNDTARAWTAVALGRICDQDSSPWVGRYSVNVQYEINLPSLLEPIYETGLLDLP